MRFTCKSSESILPSTGQDKRPVTQTSPSKKKRAAASRRKAEEKSRKKGRPDHREARLESAARSAKKKEKRADIAKHGPSFHPFIYVGNLQANITEKRLHGIFRKFGTVTRIEIRRSGGQAVTVGVAIPEEVKGSKDRFYATIEFSERSSAKSALRLNGKQLDDAALVVSLSPVDLPEMRDIVKSRVSKMDSSRTRVQPRTMPGAFDTGLFSEPTFVESTPPKTAKTPVATAAGEDRHRIMGYSFPATVI
ncbi:hypothetical protein H1R20_g5423, partial [Candolleomyces eurysporus]